jgi:hypothetical protein
MSISNLDADEREVLSIWLSNQPKDLTDLTNTSSSNTTTASTAILSFLARSDGPSPDTFDNRLGGVYGSLVEFCMQQPRSMDWALRVLKMVISSIPEGCKTQYGTGPVGVRKDFQWFLINFVGFYDGNIEPDVGMAPWLDEDVVDASNIQFSAEDAQMRTEEVIKKMNNMRKIRWKTIILMVIAGRCHALDVARTQTHGSPGNNLVQWIDYAFKLEKREGIPPWNRVDCLADLTMLRGSAKSLLGAIPDVEREGKLKEWIEGVTRLLVTGSDGRQLGDKADDFHIKAHAAVSAILVHDAKAFLVRILTKCSSWLYRI